MTDTYAYTHASSRAQTHMYLWARFSCALSGAPQLHTHASSSAFKALGKLVPPLSSTTRF